MNRVRFVFLFSFLLVLFSVPVYASDDSYSNEVSKESGMVSEYSREDLDYVGFDQDGNISVRNEFDEGFEVSSESLIDILESDRAPLLAAAFGSVPGACFIDCSTSQLGNVSIIVPVDWQRGSLSFDSSGNLFNIRSSTINGIVFKGNTKYSFRVNSFSNPQYRLLTGTQQWVDLTVTDVSDTNVQIVSSSDDLPLFPSDQMIYICIFALLGVILVCLWFKR